MLAKTGNIGEVKCSIQSSLEGCNGYNNKTYNKKIVLTFYRSSYPTRIEIISENGENCSEMVNRAFSKLLEKIKKTYEGKIDVKGIENFILNFKDTVLKTL